MLSVDHIKADLIMAMKSGEVLKLSVLRMLLSELHYKWIELQHDLSDGEILAVIGNEAKKRREAIGSFEKGGRPEQAAKEKRELEMLQVYMPNEKISQS